MKTDTIARLDSSAAKIAQRLVCDIQNGLLQKKQRDQKTQLQEIATTISLKANRWIFEPLVDGNLDNISKSKEQLDYLAQKVVDIAKTEYGVDL